MRELAFDQADVDLEVRDASGDLLGVGDVQGELGAGVVVEEARHQRHGDVVADGEGGADAQADRAAIFRQGRLESLRSVENRLGFGA